MFEQDFEAMLGQYADAIDDKKRFKGLVKDFFPDQIKNINLLLMAYDLGIAQDMKEMEHINNAFAYRYVKQLVDDYGLSRINADWIVSVWCVSYGKNLLGKQCDIRLQEKSAGPSVKEEGENSATQKYGDLFRYSPCADKTGLSVCGFGGENKQTIVCQNRAAGKAVVEVGAEAFRGQPVEVIILTEGFRTIGARALADCKRLHQVVMSATLVEIGDYALENCSNLKSLSLPGLIERIGNGALKGTGLRSLILPDSLFWLGEGVLSDCRELEGISVPQNIERLPERMLEGCTSLKRVALHEKLVAIGERAFADCSSLDILTIPNSVTSIGEDVFSGTDKQFIIQCSFGSYAEEYARKNKIKYQLV